MLTKPRCTLCHRPAKWRGVFLAHDQSRVSAPPGKTRAISYLLCRRCKSDPTHQRRVESMIFRDFAHAQN